MAAFIYLYWKRLKEKILKQGSRHIHMLERSAYYLHEEGMTPSFILELSASS